MSKKPRQLKDLCSVGSAAVKDFSLLGISNVDQLKGRNAGVLYHELCKKTKVRHDPCVIDVFRAAIEQAENPNLEPEKCYWWFWTKLRKQGRE